MTDAGIEGHGDRRQRQRELSSSTVTSLGRTSSVTKSDAETDYEYDGDGNLVQATDADGNVTEFVYDGANRKTEATIDPGADEITTRFIYDGVGNLLTSTRSGLAATSTTFTYDARYQLVSEQDALLTIPRPTVTDANGNMIEATDPLDRVTTYTYDEFSRSIDVDETARGGGITRYEYDNNGNLITETDALDHITTYTYDALNRVTDQEQTVGGVSREWQTEYAEPAGGKAENEVTLTDPNGQESVVTIRLPRPALRSNLLTFTTPPSIDGEVLAASTELRSYGDNGNLLTADQTEMVGGQQVVQHTANTYDEFDRLLTTTNSDGETITSNT